MCWHFLNQFTIILSAPGCRLVIAREASRMVARSQTQGEGQGDAPDSDEKAGLD